MKKNNKGFTLAELLIVVAIIAVLVAIAIPVFGAQLEKSREATDAANIRAKYADVMVAMIEDAKTDHTESVTLKQAKAGWQNSDLQTGLETLADGSLVKVNVANPTAGGKGTVKYTTSDGIVNITVS